MELAKVKVVGSRDVSVDISKGIGIVLVVIGHSWLAIKHPPLFDLIYSFHMPLFFFLSGMFFNGSGDYGRFALTKADQLLKPFYVVLLSFGMLKLVMAGADLQAGMVGVLYGSGNTIPLVSLWFLAHLWVTFQVAWLVENSLRFSRISKTAQAAILLIILGAGYYILQFFSQLTITLPGSANPTKAAGLPLSLDVSLISTAFFLIGFRLRRAVMAMRFSLPFLLCATGAFAALLYFFDHSLNLNQRQYGNPFVTTLVAMLGIYIVLSISRQRADVSCAAGKVLAYLGRQSLFILIFHGSIQSIGFTVMSQFAGEYLVAFVAALVSICVPLVLGIAIHKFGPLRAVFLPKHRK